MHSTILSGAEYRLIQMVRAANRALEERELGEELRRYGVFQVFDALANVMDENPYHTVRLAADHLASRQGQVDRQLPSPTELEARLLTAQDRVRSLEEALQGVVDRLSHLCTQPAYGPEDFPPDEDSEEGEDMTIFDLDPDFGMDVLVFVLGDDPIFQITEEEVLVTPQTVRK